MNKSLESGKCHISLRDGREPLPNFFPTNGGGVSKAISYCMGCEVRQECLDYAISERLDYGVWGGTSERARAEMVREQKLTVNA